MHRQRRIVAFTAAAAAVLTSAAVAAPTTPQALLDSYAQAAATRPDPKAGEKFFNATHAREWSCASCHTANPTQAGKHASTGKSIQALAPAAEGTRFTDVAKTEKWFRRNCNDVLARECTAGEKANLLAWLVSLKP